jgi:hypothetical protein
LEHNKLQQLAPHEAFVSNSNSVVPILDILWQAGGARANGPRQPPRSERREATRRTGMTKQRGGWAVGGSNLISRTCRTVVAGVFLAWGWVGHAQAQNVPPIAGIDEFVECSSAWPHPACVKGLEVYVMAHPDQAFAAGRAVTFAMTHWLAIPFFETAFNNQAQSASCKDERLALAVISGLALPRSAEHEAMVTAAQRLLSVTCWKALRGPVLKALAPAVGYLPANVCPVLAAKKEKAPACSKRPAPQRTPAAPRWENLNPKSVDVEGPVLVYRGDRSQLVTMVKVKGRDYYLIKFEGALGTWANQVVLHREERLGDRGTNYWTLVNGNTRYVSLVYRGSPAYGYSSFYEVHPRGDRSFSVSYDAEKSKAADPKALLAEWRR